MVTFKVGDVIEYIDAEGYYRYIALGKEYVAPGKWGLCREHLNIVDDKGDEVGMSYTRSKLATETEAEAERRGAKFGMTGIVSQSGVVVSFISDKNHKNGLGEALWDVVDEEGTVYPIHPENIRLDHEPEFVAWSEAPEHLRYDASRVYCEGKPVKWIAKPEGAFVKAVFVLENGRTEFSYHKLTVKL